MEQEKLAQGPETGSLAKNAPDRFLSGVDSDSHPMLNLILLLVLRKRLIVFCTCFASVLAVTISLLVRPTYTATATFLPPETPQSAITSMPLVRNLSSVAGLNASSLLSPPADLYVSILESRTITDHAIAQFHLQQQWHIKTLAATEKEVSLRMHFEVAKNGLIRVSAQDQNPKQASDLANFYVGALYQVNQALASTEAAERSTFFKQRLQIERIALAAAEEDLRKTKQRTGLLSLDGQLVAAVRAVAYKRAQVSTLEVTLQGLRLYASDDNPEVQRTAEELRALRVQLAVLESGQNRETAGDIETATSQVPIRSLEYIRRLRDADYHETLVSLLSRMQAVAQIDEARSAPPIQVVDHAVPLDDRSGPPRLLTITGGSFMGFAIGCALVFLLSAIERAENKDTFPDKIALLFGVQPKVGRDDASGVRAGVMIQKHSMLKIRNPRDIPFYSSPSKLFFTEWMLMLATFMLHISFASYPDMSVALLLFALSTAGFLGGFLTLRWSYAARAYSPRGTSEYYRIDISPLRWFHRLGVLFVAAILIMNLKRFGLPPFFGAILDANTLGYQEYGSLRVPMATVILSMFISAPLEKTPWRRWALYLFCPACFLLYSSRGYLLILLFQALIVFSLRTARNKQTIYLIAAVTLTCAVLLSNFIGNSRSTLGVDALLGYLQIKQRYYNWPAAYLWVISYISTPFSNMCWIVRVFPYQHPSFNFLYSVLPGEKGVQSFEMIGDLGSEKIIDGVHTYMAKYFIDFWYFGILGINYVWGLISAALEAGNRLTRNFLLSGVLLGCMGFIFFSDFLTILIIVLEMLVVVVLQAMVIKPVDLTAEH